MAKKDAAAIDTALIQQLEEVAALLPARAYYLRVRVAE